MVHKVKYIFSFTGASALIAETLVIAEEYDRLKDWKAVEKSLTDNNLLNKVKQATFKREFSEIKKRLSLLTEGQLQLMIQGNLEDAKAIIQTEKNAALRDVKAQVAAFSLEVAEKLIKKNLSDDKAQKDLAEAYIKELKLN